MNPMLYFCVMLGAVFLSGVAALFPSYKKIKQEYKNSIKLDISVEQMLQSEKKISEFYSLHKLKPGTPIEEIAKILNVSEGDDSEGIQGQARIDKIDNGRLRVTFKEGLTEAQHNFNFAHECAHIINEDPVPATRPDEKNKPQIEQLADYTAAALLMPFEDVYNFLILQNYTGVSKHKKIRIVNALCRRYNVSDIIAMRRIKEIFAIKKSA